MSFKCSRTGDRDVWHATGRRGDTSGSSSASTTSACNESNSCSHGQDKFISGAHWVYKMFARDLLGMRSDEVIFQKYQGQWMEHVQFVYVNTCNAFFKYTWQRRKVCELTAYKTPLIWIGNACVLGQSCATQCFATQCQAYVEAQAYHS